MSMRLDLRLCSEVGLATVLMAVMSDCSVESGLVVVEFDSLDHSFLGN
jgi:hypothetical protein